MQKKPKFRWSAILSAGVTLLGVLADPHVLDLLPAQATTAIAIGGVVLQALTKPVARKDEERAVRSSFPPPR